MAGKLKAWAGSVGSDVKQSMANELNYARDDIRQKIVEEGWTGSPQTDKGHFYETKATSEPETEPAEDVDIQGNRIEGEDFSGTVWEQENRNEIEPMNVPDISDQAPDIEPDD